MQKTIKVKILGDSKDLERNLNASQKRIQAFAKVAATAVLAVGAAMVIMAKRSFVNIDAQAKLAQSLNTTVKSMQVLKRAGDLAGVSMQGIEQATKDLTRRLSQAASGTGPAADALDRLNLTAERLNEVPLDQRARLINEAIDQFIPSAERAAVAGQLFGEEGSIAMARLDSATLEQATRDIDDFGIAVSEVDAEKIERFNDSLSRLMLILEGIGNSIAIWLSEPLDAATTALAAFFAKAEESTLGTFGEAIDNVTLALGDEIRETKNLMDLMGTSGRMSSQAALSKLSQAEAHLRAAEAQQAEARALQELQMVEIQRDLQLANEARSVVHTDEAYKMWDQTVAGLLTQMNNLNAAMNEPATELDETRDRLEAMRDAIAKAEGGMVKFSNETINASGLTNRLAGAASAVNFDSATASAAQLSEQLGIALSVATRISGMSAVSRAGVSGPDAAIAQLQNEGRLGGGGLQGIVSTLTVGPRSKSSTGSGSGGGAGGGGSSVEDAAMSAEEAIEKMLAKVADTEMAEAQRELDDFAGKFTSVLSEADSLKDVIGSIGDMFGDMLKQAGIDLARSGIMQLFTGNLSGQLDGNSGGGIGGAMMGFLESFDGGGSTGAGSRSGGRLAMIHPNETITDHTKGGGGGGGYVDRRSYSIDARGAQVGVAEQIQQAMQEMDRKAPARQAQIGRNPRNR